MIKREKLTSPVDGRVYMTRYMPWFTKRLCINIIESDTEFMHNHPWDYFTLILWGGYRETVLVNGKETVKLRYPGYFSFRKYDNYHFVQPIKGRTITLFYRSKNKTKNTKFLINGREINELKYWYTTGISKSKLRNLSKNNGI